MHSVLSMIEDLDASVANGGMEKRTVTLRKVVDLFLTDAALLNEEQIDLFDVVIARLASEIETRARIELAERLADVSNAPRGIIRTLAHDQIVVARPVLSRSERLSDEDLVAVALAKGRDHMLAMSERSVLTEPVTEVLISRGDRLVIQTVAENKGARFSEGTFTTLIDRSRQDEALRTALSERTDIAESHVRQLLTIAKEAARLRLSDTLSKDQLNAAHFALERSAVKVQSEVAPHMRHYAEAMEKISFLAESGVLEENELRQMAEARKIEETICALSFMAGLSIPSVERLFNGAEVDLVLVVGKAEGWSWNTVQSLIALRQDGEPGIVKLHKLQDTYTQLSASTAQRVIHFLKVREATQKKTAESVAIRHANLG